MITISISHIIYLDKNERYDLYHGKKIKKIGFFVPVCFCNGETSEPAHEIFCKYFLTNENEFVPITKCENGFRINIFSNEQNQDLLSNPISLLDWESGGIGSFHFKEKGQIRIKNNYYSIIHTVHIEDMDVLKESLN
jgi:hypothetical protein